MDLRKALAALRRMWWVVVVGALLGGLAGAAVGLLATPRYTTQTQFFVSTADSASTSEAFAGSQFAQQRVASYAGLLEGEELAARVIDDLGLDRTTASLQDAVEVSPVPETVLIDVSVTDPSPERARALAASLSSEFLDLVAELETPVGGTASAVRVTVTDRPDLPTEASSPDVLRTVAAGVLGGLVLGALVALARDLADRSVTTAEEASALTGAPVVGVVVRDPALGSRSGRGGEVRSDHAAEGYRQVRANLQFLDVDQPPKVVMVSSAVPAEGKTTAVVNLGLALARAGHRVTLVEADLRKPRVIDYLGLVDGVGLTNVLTGSAGLEDVVQQHATEGLSVIGAGPVPPNPGELLASSSMRVVLEKLRADNDFVLVDAAPLLPVADAIGLAAHTDGALLSVRYGVTRREQVAAAAARLERVGARTLGVVLNLVPPKAELASEHGYGYGYAAETRA
ncbi:polysaccharide biosynthesis tyrosine autokinase [Geodermatophilus chilensis]|uniref:polysaccharide biosynthesis tyrosine autokinase n=1 Tax=Geodermatophilus chilensis TaxID=2035835 RepID=UPI000C25B9E6|nr:polysaccharide biosynthesis tyrosine autokinase [Geodermatophilus chilensis]